MSRLRILLVSLILLCAATRAASAATSRVVTRVVAARDTVPPIPPGRIGYSIDEIVIYSATDPNRPICPRDSVRVGMKGIIYDGCRRRIHVELLPPLEASPLPHPPVVRVVVADTQCGNPPCPHVLQPWEASATLPPLPPGDYQLHLLFDRATCTDSVVASAARDASFPVTERCGFFAPDSCLLPDWEHPNGLRACDGEAGPGQEARLDFRIHSTVALAGVQGEFEAYPPGLRITQLEPIGPASDMLLRWTPTERGAKFVLFSTRGAPIPATPTGVSSPIMRVTVAQPPNRPAAPRTSVSTRNLLGSDLHGGPVRWCYLDCPFCWLSTPVAVVCAPRDCDVNEDGRSDVRDLVQMVRCLRDSLCGADDPRHFDCDRDSVFGVGDLICCARHMLRPPACPDCPPDTTGSRPGAGVEVRIGSPVATDVGLDVPVTVAGANGLGAARVGLTFPRDRWEVAGVDFASSGSHWLALDDAGASELALGWVRISSPDLELSFLPLQALVHLRLKPGQDAGGEIAVTAGEFSAHDGVRLDVDLGRPAVSLGAPVMIDLAANRPNPFARETRFSVTLDRIADVELGVYDVGGRRVASIHRGRLGPGPHEFGWNGRDDAVRAAGGGMYFYRATADGQVHSRKMVLLGTP